MKKYLFIFFLSGICIADMVILKNGQSFDGLLVGMKDNNILFKDKYNKIIYLRTETIEYLGLSSGEIIIKDGALNLPNDQKADLLLSYSYEEQKKLYESYNPPGSMVIAGCCSFIILAMIISSSSSSKSSSDNGGFWRAFENFMNGFFND
tara:strand:+ start:380 stop:829 length:450 start_codon:yes stop_codon:yes gene_type:complete